VALVPCGLPFTFSAVLGEMEMECYCFVLLYASFPLKKKKLGSGSNAVSARNCCPVEAFFKVVKAIQKMACSFVFIRGSPNWITFGLA